MLYLGHFSFDETCNKGMQGLLSINGCFPKRIDPIELEI